MTRTSLIALIALVAATTLAHGQPFDSGSDGSYGPLECLSGTCVLDMPPDGIFHCTTITVAQGATLRFNKNKLNTAVYLLATGDVVVAGSVDVSGTGPSSNPPARGRGGPGGFDGGNPGLGSLVPPGDGQGPGAGLAGTQTTNPDAAGAGAYGSPSSRSPTASDGQPYGSPLLFPLLGGSGGGGTIGTPGVGGGGGGGAVLIASNTQVEITSQSGGSIHADGGLYGYSYENAGSGGAIRIVAPSVTGNGTLTVQGGGLSTCGPAGCGGPGRVRVDSLAPPAVNFLPAVAGSVGEYLRGFPLPLPRLDLIRVAGRDIAEGEPEPVLIQLPFGSPATQTVTVQARNFVGVLPIRVVATPEHGSRVVVDADIDMTGIALGDPGQVSVQVDIPINTPTRIHAWTR